MKVTALRKVHQDCPSCTCSTGGVVRWRPLVIVLLFVASWDTVGLMIGDRLYSSPSYDVLRDMSGVFSVGGYELGFRAYGLGLGCIAAVLMWSLLGSRRKSGVMSRRLRLALSGLAAWWASWCTGIATSFFLHGEVYAWGSLGKLLGISAIAVIAARVPPPAPCEPSEPGSGEGLPPPGR